MSNYVSGMVLFRRHESRWDAFRAAARSRLGRRPRLAICAGVLVAAAAVYVGMLNYTEWVPFDKFCRKGEYGPPDKCAYYDRIYFLLLKAFYFVDEHNGLLVALFTGVLWYSTDKLRRFSIISHQATHRPLLRIRSIESDGGSDGLTWVYVVNIGSGAAKNIRFDAITRYTFSSPGRGDGRMTPQNQLISPKAHYGKTTLTVADRTNYSTRSLGDFGFGGVLSTVTGDTHWDVVGRITYEDEAGKRRETGFSWRYDAEAFEFRRPDLGDQHNYED